MEQGKWIVAFQLFFITVLLLACPAGNAIADAGASGTEEAYELLSQGLHHYRRDRYEQAREAFETLIEARPHWKVMRELHQRLEPGELTEVITDVTFREVTTEKQAAAEAAETIMRMMTEAQRRGMLHIEDVDQVLEDFRTGSHQQFHDARSTLIEHGRYSVPYLLDFLAGTGEEKSTLVARTLTTLRDIGRPASPPLVAALRTDNDVLKHRIVSALENVGDRRAIPALLAVAEDERVAEETAETAWDAIGAIQQRIRYPVDLQSATEEYRKLARLYLEEDASRVGHVLGGHTEIWSWDGDEEQMRRRLSIEFVPSTIYYQARGVRVALDGLNTTPGDLPLQGLLIALMSREISYLERYEANSEHQHHAYARQKLGTLRSAFNRIAHLYGAPAAGRGLGEVLSVHDEEAALRIIKVLRDSDTVSSEHAADVLCRTLDHDSVDVRFQGALAILRSSPGGEICTPEKVIRVLKNILEQHAEAPQEYRQMVLAVSGVVAERALVMRNYPIGDLESAFLFALGEYGEDEELLEQITICLKAFGSGRAAEPLSGMAADADRTGKLRIRACSAINSIARREPDHSYGEEVFQALLGALEADDEHLQREAASALHALRQPPDDMFNVAEKEIRATKILDRDDMPDVDVGP